MLFYNISPSFEYCRRPESNRYERLVPQDFKSCASASSATAAYIERLWGLQGSNLWPSACKADALPAELRPHNDPEETRTLDLRRDRAAL